MSEKPKRSLFRFHLLTAVLMMIACGFLFRIETRSKPISDGDMEYLAAVYNERYAMEIEGQEVAETEYGWPWIVLRQADNPILMHRRVRVWYVKNAVVDGIVAILMGCCAVFLSESIIRRREGNKPRERATTSGFASVNTH